MTEDEIVKICYLYSIKNYKINSDMSIDVDGDVNLFRRNLTIIPLKFGKVTGNFTCKGNHLTSLENCPYYVGQRFNCSDNDITTLQHLSINFHVGENFFCHLNNIRDLTMFGRLFFGYIGGRILTGFDDLNIFLNANKNPPKKDLPRLLSELRKINSNF